MINQVPWDPNSYLSMYSAVSWVQVIFLLAMQAILVIRVHALLNRSRGVLVFLATYYCLQTTATLVMGSVLTNTRALHGFFVSIGRCAFGSVVQTCVSDSNSSTGRGRLNLNITIVSLIFDTLLLSFALLAFVRHALEAKRLDGGWSTNMLVRTLVADQLMYFVCFLGWMSIALVLDYNDEANVFTDSTTDIVNALYLASRALAMGAGPRMITGIRAIEKKTRQEGESMGGELSTIRFGIQEPLMDDTFEYF
ncbi:hypothetical protein BJ138DRAFT_839629 [Hygrophoropsis aurantiaca]|uniref:Uncharacterized protein n=1 Tax=Hygrophoropsis aurantiaca TaxID=72124 RepID=A0ACB7ZV97_9AGAM|nr:hypothetical protein BJ138DRAFT_839629 [Hygrophoropsis aurantiaca]